ncbi:MAG: response regulator transcription factor [Clostridium sp.]|jgi:DNA-binding response OmpR family regulator|uniref:response regulator transcription factor n=1 Tax=Bacillota TaxID=1239 RepID=UPI00145D8C08|nr:MULTISPECIES: response regulator transcription factor [unclassified Clostridium]MCI7441776.1 response regulator transcription factor [Clostridium sp.]MDD7682816.1 response regulator transcription factor [Clostridium sp.]MDY2580863.1 response regulator transcription factor [Clostridium sp.]NME84364.1 response regulator transcription factor [Clostridium sp. SM-530-WT-3G]
MFNILIVDDEIKITQVIKAYLDKEGYNCIVANNGEQALKYFYNNNFDLIILDRMIPDISGEDICKKIRETSMVHIIMLTAKIEDEDRIDGFNIGCDDYVCKPFNVKELVLRVKAVFRKMGENKDILKFSDELEINMLSHNVKVRGESVILTNTEYKILLLLAKNPSRVFSREQLLELTIDEHYEKMDRIIDAHIKNLRQKIELDTKKPTIIQTVYGVGYKFGL